jgi:threonine dehydratase
MSSYEKKTTDSGEGSSVSDESEYDSDSEEIKDPWCDPDNPRIVGFAEITAASFMIRSGIIRTPCDVSRIV